jgi:hypothetical protein
LPPITAVSGNGDSLQDRFEAFHEANPHVYQALRDIALACYHRGKKIGMKAIYERLRWEYILQTDDQPYRLNNIYTPYYARLLMVQEPELGGYFEIRKVKGDDDG